jgi:hypothetical protein
MAEWKYTPPKPVRGTLELRNPDGSVNKVIEMTLDEVHDAPNHYTQDVCERIRVYYDDGTTIRRPYRFVQTQVTIRHGIDEETGEEYVSF